MVRVRQLLPELSGGGKSELRRTRCRVTPGGLNAQVLSHGECHRKHTVPT